MRTCADRDDAVPGFVEIDLAAPDGGRPGQHAWTLTVTDFAKQRINPQKAQPIHR